MHQCHQNRLMILSLVYLLVRRLVELQVLRARTDTSMSSSKVGW